MTNDKHVILAYGKNWLHFNYLQNPKNYTKFFKGWSVWSQHFSILTYFKQGLNKNTTSHANLRNGHQIFFRKNPVVRQFTSKTTITFYNNEKMNKRTVVHNLFLPQKSFPWANRAFFPAPYKRTAAFKIQKKKLSALVPTDKRGFFILYSKY